MINYIKIDETNIPVNNLTVLTGKNGTGKSHILRSVDMFFSGITSKDVHVSINNDEKHNVILCDSDSALNQTSFCNRYEADLLNLMNIFISSFKTKWTSRKLSRGDLSIINIVSKIKDGIKKGQCNVVLIDDIETHIHPSLHSSFLKNLLTIFDECQFIISTHSPLILGEVHGSNVRVLNYKDDKLSYFIPDQTFGLNSSEILRELMFTIDQNELVLNSLTEIHNLIDANLFTDASEKLNLLEKLLNGSTPDIVHCRSLIAMMGILNKTTWNAKQ